MLKTDSLLSRSPFQSRFTGSGPTATFPMSVVLSRPAKLVFEWRVSRTAGSGGCCCSKPNRERRMLVETRRRFAAAPPQYTPLRPPWRRAKRRSVRLDSAALQMESRSTSLPFTPREHRAALAEPLCTWAHRKHLQRTAGRRPRFDRSKRALLRTDGRRTYWYSGRP